MDIETILQKLGYKKVFKKDGTLTVSGNKAYGKILEVLYDLSTLGIITENTNTIVDRLDEIIDGKVY